MPKSDSKPDVQTSDVDGFQQIINKLQEIAEKEESLNTEGLWKHDCDHCGGVRGFLEWLQMGHDVMFWEKPK